MKIIISQERKDRLYKHFENFMSNLNLKLNDNWLGLGIPAFESGKDFVFLLKQDYDGRQVFFSSFCETFCVSNTVARWPKIVQITSWSTAQKTAEK